MNRSAIRNPLHISLLATTFLLQLTHAQVGTITQDVFNLEAFPSQRPCAQKCFVITGFCNADVVASAIGCSAGGDCAGGNWQATNDCYCKTDLQQPAQDFLTNCVKQSCTVGNSKIDASSAGSIYAQYCVEKGYSLAAEPATVQATTTGSGASTGTVGGGASGGPTASSTSDSQGSSSGSGNLSTSTIIGIAVGGLVCLAFLVIALKMVFNWLGCGGGQREPYRQPAVYPMNMYPGLYYEQKTESEVTPDDSVSMVSGMPRPAPTLVSNVQNYPRHRY